jgi:acid stress-induced BolA-like protein IbaG/YrbA
LIGKNVPVRMESVEKIETALRKNMSVDRVDLQDDNGIIGFVVSKDFQDVSSTDRQTMIHRILRTSPDRLTKAEVRRIGAIATLTPDEFLVWSG